MHLKLIFRGAALIATALTLSACAAVIEEEVGECEPGVGDISQIATAVPQPTC